MSTQTTTLTSAGAAQVLKTARTAGFLYLLSMALLIFAEVAALQNLIVRGDAAETARRITAHVWQFRIGCVSELVSTVLFLLAAWALYVLLRPVSENGALLFLLLNLAGCSVACINMINLFAALQLLSGADSLRVIEANQLHAVALFFLDAHRIGFMIAQIFYGAWLLPLGCLVVKSGFLPRMLGILLLADFVGVLIWFFQFFLFPGYEAVTYPGLAISFVAEFGLALWLLLRGVKAIEIKVGY